FIMSLSAPSLAGENGKKSRIFPATPLIASVTFPAAFLIPSAIEVTMFLPALKKSLTLSVTAVNAFDMPSLILPLTLFIPSLTAVFTLFQISLNVFKMLDRIEVMIFNAPVICERIRFTLPDQIDFAIPLAASHTPCQSPVNNELNNLIIPRTTSIAVSTIILMVFHTFLTTACTIGHKKFHIIMIVFAIIWTFLTIMSITKPMIVIMKF